MNIESESVCIFVRAYNASKFIEDCLKSIKEQTFSGKIYVKILYDMGTNDNTLEVLNKINLSSLNNDNRSFELINHPNSSPFRALRKYGFEKFEDKYSYFAILDYDNLFMPDYLELAIKNISKDPKGNFLYSIPIKIDISGNNIGYLVKNPILPITYLKYIIIFGNFIDASAIFMDRKCMKVIISKIKLLKSKTYDWIFEDWLIGALALKYCNVSFLSTPKIYYRIHSSNITYNNTTKDNENYNRGLLTISALFFLNNDSKMLKIVSILSALLHQISRLIR